MTFKGSYAELAAARERERHRGRGRGEVNRLGILNRAAIRFDGEPVLPLRKNGQPELPICAGDSLGLSAVAGKPDPGGGDWRAGRIVQHSLPDGLLRTCCSRG